MSDPTPEVLADISEKLAAGYVLSPPNPHYVRKYVCSLAAGHAELMLPAPGGKFEPQDAADICDWLELIMSNVKRYAAPPLTPKTP